MPIKHLKLLGNNYVLTLELYSAFSKVSNLSFNSPWAHIYLKLYLMKLKFREISIPKKCLWFDQLLTWKKEKRKKEFFLSENFYEEMQGND